MQDEVLLNMALIIATLGIAILLILSYFDKIPEKSFNDITSIDVGARTKVQGVVKQIYPHNNSITIRLKQECVMDVTSFERDLDKKLGINVGDNLSVQGAVQEYQGKMNILADKVTRIN